MALLRFSKIFLQSVVTIKFNEWEQHVNCGGVIWFPNSSVNKLSFSVLSEFLRIFSKLLTSISESSSMLSSFSSSTVNWVKSEFSSWVTLKHLNVLPKFVALLHE